MLPIEAGPALPPSRWCPHARAARDVPLPPHITIAKMAADFGLACPRGGPALRDHFQWRSGSHTGLTRSLGIGLRVEGGLARNFWDGLQHWSGAVTVRPVGAAGVAAGHSIAPAAERVQSKSPHLEVR